MRVSRVSVPGPYVALTFDDGPSGSLTPQVLDILKRHDARATFFVLGQNAARHQSILARAAAEGHEIGNHSYSHIKMTGAGKERVCREMERTNAVIEAATGRAPRVMRPPYGATNSNLVSMLSNNYGLTSVLWDVDTRDWQRPGVNVVVRRAVGEARPGSIILLHDIHPPTLAAVEDIVTGLQARGFRLVTVSQLIALGRRAAGAAGVGTAAPAAQTSPAAQASPATPSVEASPAPQSAAEASAGAGEVTLEPSSEARETETISAAADQPLPSVSVE